MEGEEREAKGEKKIFWEDKHEDPRITPGKRKGYEQILEVLVNVEAHSRFSHGLVSQLFVENGIDGLGLL